MSVCILEKLPNKVGRRWEMTKELFEEKKYWDGGTVKKKNQGENKINVEKFESEKIVKNIQEKLFVCSIITGALTFKSLLK